MFAKLIREGDAVPCAIMMKLYREKTGYEEYFCIPHYNSSPEIWKKAYDDFLEFTNQWDSWQARGYTWPMIKLISHAYTAGE